MDCFDGSFCFYLSAFPIVINELNLVRRVKIFEHQLQKLQINLECINPIFNDVLKLNQMLNQRKYISYGKITKELMHGEVLAQQCLNIRFNLLKKFILSSRLKRVNDQLFEFFPIDVQADGKWNTEQMAVEVSNAKLRVDRLLVEAEQILRAQRAKLGWRIPDFPRGIVAFSEPLKKLKAKFINTSEDDFSGGSMEIVECRDECSVVVVAAGGGCGRTTLATMLCHDPQIQATYRENIFFVTVSEKRNFMATFNDLSNSNQVMALSNEDAKFKLHKFLCDQAARGPILLVLDGVQSDLFIKNFEFNIRGYKILVTSKIIFPKYGGLQLDPLSDEDAKKIFMRSSSSEREGIPSPSIDEGLVNLIVKCCKKHPHTLSVVGSSLKGKYEFVWKSVMKTLSLGDWVLDNSYETKRLQRIVVQADEEFERRLLDFEALDEELKQCLLDLGSFPSNYKVAARALLDMWTNLYDHDDMGRDTLTKIFQLADRNLASSITIGEEANAIVNYCDQAFITQQDLQRELAIHFSSKEPISRRTRLIIDVQGCDLPAPVEATKEVMSARILSISTGESFSSRWCNINVPEVEVMVLNMMSQTYTLPHFLEDMQKLKVLIVTNCGLHPTKFVNIHLLSSLTSLTRIRLEGVVLSLLSTPMLALVNLQVLSFIMCKVSNCFEQLSTHDSNVWPSLVEIEIDSCQDLVRFPELYCNSSVHLEKLSITNCNEMSVIPEEVGKLTSLETLSLRSCTKLEKLPVSISKLKKLGILDISECSSLNELPENIGELSGLRMLYMKGCTGIRELPPSIKDLSQPQVLCNEEISYKWREFLNVKIPVVEEDILFTITENISYACF